MAPLLRQLTAPVTTIMKFSRFYDPSFGQNLGGIFMQSGNDILGWGWDVEDRGNCHLAGPLTECS